MGDPRLRHSPPMRGSGLDLVGRRERRLRYVLRLAAGLAPIDVHG
jgi:hypothetical protein